MTSLTQVLFVALVSYLTGAIPFGFLIARWRGVNIFQQGSGNIGATNVGRVLGKRFGILVFLLDFSKGALPVLAAPWLGGLFGSLITHDSLKVTAGLAAFVGHIFPVYLRFRGGKGVATGAGVVAVLLPGPALGALVTWVAVLCATRYVSLASLLAVVVLAGLRLLTTAEPFAREKRILTLFCFAAAGLVGLRHRSNIARLLQGTENRIKETSAMLQLTKTIHVLSLGLWFGSVVFFTWVVALVIFQSFESLADKGADRPAWLGDSFDKDKASQLAGLAVGPIFHWYFLLQGVCGFLAIATALAWTRSEAGRKVHKLRFYILTGALITVLAGWPLAQKVSALRAARYAADAAVAAAAKTDFVSWHLYSLLLNQVTLLLVAVAMALAANLPSSRGAAAVNGEGCEPLDSKRL